jgi:predicted transcriptional regulator
MAEHGVDEDKRETLRRFAAFGAATPLAGLGSRESDTSDVRDAIVGYVARTPGAHFSKVRDDLQLGTGETQHHLRRLLDAGTLVSRRDGDYRRFFPADRFTDFEQVALGFLRRDTPRALLLACLRDPGRTGSALAAALDVSRPTVSTTGRALAEAGLLDREDGYRVAAPETVIKLLVRYADSFDAAAATFAGDVDEYVTYTPK